MLAGGRQRGRSTTTGRRRETGWRRLWAVTHCRGKVAIQTDASVTHTQGGGRGWRGEEGRSTAIAGGAQRAAWTGIIVNARVKIEVVGHLEAHRVVREQLQLEDERHRHERERGHLASAHDQQHGANEPRQRGSERDGSSDGRSRHCCHKASLVLK